MSFLLVTRFRMQGSRSWPTRSVRWLRPKPEIFTSTKQQRCGEKSSVRKTQNRNHFYVVTKIRQLSVCYLRLGSLESTSRYQQLRPVQKSVHLVCCASTFHQHFCTELKIDLLSQQMFLCLLWCCHVMKWLEIQKQHAWCLWPQNNIAAYTACTDIFLHENICEPFWVGLQAKYLFRR